MPNYTESTTLEAYYKNDSDKHVFVKLTDEVFKDGIQISSKLREVSINEASELGTTWDEDTICKITNSTRRPVPVEVTPTVEIPLTSQD